MKISNLLTVILLTQGLAFSQSPTAPNSSPPIIQFDKSKDLFLAQFDSKPDPDDLQAIAAIGSMLAHPDLHGVDYFAVQGTVSDRFRGEKNQNNSFLRTDGLMNDAFGKQNVRWTQAGKTRRDTWPDGAFGIANENWKDSVLRVQEKAKTTLDRGGKIYVMEAGNSDFTYDWVQSLIANTDYSSEFTKSSIIVVQHSDWNETHTSSAAELDWVRENTDYRRIEDGNGNNATPNFKNNTPQWIDSVRTTQNPNPYTQNLWEKAWQGMQGKVPKWSELDTGIADFSDTVEAWYIFNLDGDSDNIDKFTKRFITNPSHTQKAPGPQEVKK
ncbi:MAG: hypothetical protein AAGC74_04285 [Verrucomicrobiota bacterium]